MEMGWGDGDSEFIPRSLVRARPSRPLGPKWGNPAATVLPSERTPHGALVADTFICHAYCTSADPLYVSSPSYMHRHSTCTSRV